MACRARCCPPRPVHLLHHERHGLHHGALDNRCLWPGRSAELAGARRLNGLFRYLVLLFSLPVLFFLGFPLFRHAWSGLRRGVLSTDWLLATGVAASFVFSFLSVFRGRGPIYFEVGCVILVMTTLGRWLEANGKLKASAALDALTRLLPDRFGGSREGRSSRSPREEIKVDDRPAGTARRAISRRWAGGSPSRPRGRAGTDRREPARAQGAGRSRAGGHAQSRRRAHHPGERGRRQGDTARVVEMVRDARESKGDISGWPIALRAASFRRSLRSRSCAIGAHWAFGSLGARALGRPGGHPDRLPVCSWLGSSPGHLERAGKRRRPARPVPQRRGSGAPGGDHGGSVRQDRDSHDRRGDRLRLHRRVRG